nr:6-O-methyltransferase 2 [Phyla nodiflora]
MAGACRNHEDREAAQAQEEIWRYMFGTTEMAILKCAVEFGIPDILENHESMTLAQLSSAIGCNSPPALYRVMRSLTNRGFFKEVKTQGESQVSYSQTALSRLLMQSNLAPFLLLQCHEVTVDSGKALAQLVSAKDGTEGEHRKNIWQRTAADPSLNKLFNDAMACVSRVTTSKVLECYPAAFEGISSLVDVGGGNGTTLRALTKAFPNIRGITFDRPEVVASAPQSDVVEHVGGDFFQKIPSADAALIMWVLHNWDDDACINILKNCREAIPKDTGKVIIIDSVIDEIQDNTYRHANLILDIIMMTNTVRGRERTSAEWGHVITAAGYSKYAIKHIPALLSIIEAFP